MTAGKGEGAPFRREGGLWRALSVADVVKGTAYQLRSDDDGPLRTAPKALRTRVGDQGDFRLTSPDSGHVIFL